ncbi:MAG: EAL domain-containing protein [Pacificimonas sp.]|nr:EAL domain-containing protein [Pacificimonas sp.]
MGLQKAKAGRGSSAAAAGGVREPKIDILSAQLAAHREYQRRAAPSFLLAWMTVYGVLAWCAPQPLLPLMVGAVSLIVTLASLGIIRLLNGRSRTAELALSALAFVAATVPIYGLGYTLLPTADTDETLILAATLSAHLILCSTKARNLPFGAKLAVLVLGSVHLFALGHSLGTTGWIAGGVVMFVAVQFSFIAEASRRSLTARLARERRLEESTQNYQALLSEFEEQGSDWLFAIDDKGQLTQVSRRFAEAAGAIESELRGRRLYRLFNDTPERKQLVDFLARRSSFRGLIVPLTIKGKARFWSLSARPVEEDGVAMRGVMTDVTVAAEAEERVHRMAHFDALTDLPNRLKFTDQAEQAVAGASALNRCGLMFVDLDHFKSINDVHGHRTGDILLQATAKRLQSVVGDEGLVARLGGDEFAVLIPEGASPQSVERLAETIATTVCQVVRHDGLALEPTVSIGLAIAPDDACGLKELLHNADMALYAAKQAGRNCWRRFDSEMDAAARRRRLLASEMKGALKAGQFQLYYQPIVDARTLDLRGFETLIRWIHPERGFISPGDFIPIAEDSGFIRELGAWVLETAMAEAATWPDHLNVAVNVSPVQLRGNDVERVVADALAASRLTPTRLELEITESVLLERSSGAISSLKRLRTRGVRFSLDDFGTGFSSLSYLRTFPFNKVKIDRSFVSDMGDGGSCLAIIKAVLGLSRDMGMTTVAEGIELPGQLAALQQMGCHQIQGFLISKPLPVKEARALIKSGVSGPKAGAPDLRVTG